MGQRDAYDRIVASLTSKKKKRQQAQSEPAAEKQNTENSTELLDRVLTSLSDKKKKRELPEEIKSLQAQYDALEKEYNGSFAMNPSEMGEDKVLSYTDRLAALEEKIYEKEKELKALNPTAKDGRTYFQKGALGGGVTTQNITKAILGTQVDAQENFLQGALGLFETGTDAIATVGGKIIGTLGRAAFGDGINYMKFGRVASPEQLAAEYVAEDKINEEKIAKAIVSATSGQAWAGKVWGVNTEEDSFLGDKSDALVQSAGQLAAQYGLQMVGVPWFVTSSVSGFGGEVENALKQGANLDEAMLSGAITAGAEILSEKLFGGDLFVKNAGSDLAAGYLAREVSNKAIRTMAKLGMDIAGEGFEEVASELISNLGTALYKEEDIGQILFSEEALDGYIESFIGGMTLGGGMTGINIAAAKGKGIDYVTELTENEQKVVDKLYKDAVAEEQKKGKVTEKQKTEIYDGILQQMQKGYISTDTIEEVLGGEAYGEYKKASDKEAAALKELEGLYEGEELAKMKKYITDNSRAEKLRGKLSGDVSELVRGDRLAESYNERTRRGQVFQTDLGKYTNENARKTVQNLINSKAANNTNLTHDFAEMLAKVSADKGVVFDFTDAQKLASSAFGIKGKAVNGYVTKDGITVNLNSAKALNSVVGHEITHVLGDTAALQQALEGYLGKDAYNAKLKQMIDTYKDVDGYKGADGMDKIKEEVAADLVGDLLFTDAEFVQRLSSEHRNVFQKVYDEIKYLCRVATAGSKQARELEKVKKIFEDAYRAEDTKNPTGEGGVRYSITKPFVDSNGKQFDSAVLLDTEFFDGFNPRNWGSRLRDFVEMRSDADPFILPVVDENGNIQQLQFANTQDRVTKNGQSQHKVLDKLSSSSDNISKLAVVHIDEVVDVSNSDNPYHTTDSNHQWLDQDGWLHRTANVINAKNGNIYNLTLDIAKTKDGRHILYATDGKIKRVGNVQVNSLKIRGSGQNSNSTNNVAQSDPTVKRKDFEYQYAVSRGDTKAAQKLVDQAARDAGYTIKAYHGTDAESFYEFDKGKIGDATGVSILGDGFYFADNEKAAKQYGKNVYAVYLKQTNPYSAKESDAYRLKALELEQQGHDGVVMQTGKGDIYMVLDPNQIKSADPITYDDDGNVIPLSQRFNQESNDIRYSVGSGDATERIRGGIYGEDILLEGAAAKRQSGAETAQKAPAKAPESREISFPMPEDIAHMEAEKAEGIASNREDLAQMEAEQRAMDESYRMQTAEDGYPPRLYDEAEQSVETVKDRLEMKLRGLQWELKENQKARTETMQSLEQQIADAQAKYDSKAHKDSKNSQALLRRIHRLQRQKSDRAAEYDKRIHDIESRIGKVSEELGKDHTKRDRLEEAYRRIDQQLERDKENLTYNHNMRKYELRKELRDQQRFVSDHALGLYWELRGLKKGVKASPQLGYLLDHGYAWDDIKAALLDVKEHPGEPVRQMSAVESTVRELLGREYENKTYELEDMDAEYRQQMEQLEKDAEEQRRDARNKENRIKRADLHAGIVEAARQRYAADGMDLDEVLKNAKDLSAFATVDNTPQRVMEKALGYKEGQILADMTVNKVAQNETEGIRWLNSYTNGKDGILKQLSDRYHIKPGSKQSAAAQMYAEGFYVNEKEEIIQYGDAELAQDFPDTTEQARIKALARDPRIRQIYDDTLAMINESRTRNAYPEIPRLDNYFLHFRAMDDTFSRLGLPFNPNDIKAKDLPTDINGVTVDLKPGQPYFESAMHRKGKRTSFDLLGGLERYLTNAKNQIYHIDDIQTLRAMRNYIADTYGQANGLEGLDALTEEEAQERIEKVYGSHLSTFAKFLNEEANILAGKTALIDRGLEGVIGRRGITFLNTVNRQVGSNMVGFNLSSPLTNFLPVAQTFAKTNKADFVKAFGQTVANKVGSIFGRNDGFTENSPVAIRRKGADRFHRTMWQKISDPGYALMGAVDDISTELIARTKYNELTRKGMDSQKAHLETDKWVSRLMGDRSLGQQPQLYNSRMLGLITKFQLEVRNQLDSQFYDTIQEAKASNAQIEDGLKRNARTAAKVASTFVQLAVAQHLFGKAFESVAGYNPAFDIIEVMIKTFGWDDDEESEDTALDNMEEGFLALLEDLPYTSTFTGGRIPIASALPVEELVMGKDEYGNEKSRWETLGEALPYYIMPGGYGQIKKTVAGLQMFDEDLPVSGSYTESGNLRFPVEEGLAPWLQAALFGQWANENARDYFENERSPLNEKQTQEFIDTGMTIQQYWDYREGLSALNKASESGTASLNEKGDYIGSLDLTTEQKNILINNAAGRKTPIDMSTYDDYPNFEEFDFGTQHPGKYALSQAVGGYEKYKTYREALGKIEGEKDAEGNTIQDSKKIKVVAYINSLDADYGEKILLYKSMYPGDDTYDLAILQYLDAREDITAEEMLALLRELKFDID